MGYPHVNWRSRLLCIILAGAGVAGGWFYAAERARSPEAIRQTCLSRVESLGRALEQYARDNKGELPVELTDLYPGYIPNLSICECPRSRRSRVTEKYQYDNRPTADTNFTSIVVYDPPGTHEAIGMGGHAALMRKGKFAGVTTFSGDEIRMLAAVQERGFAYARDGNQAAFEELLQIMNESEGTVHDAAEEVLSVTAKPQTAKLLVTELEKEKVQDQAAKVLTSIGKEAVPELIRASEAPGPTVRAKAVGSLGEIGDESALPTLFNKLSDSDENVRAAAARSLGKMDPQRVLPLLTKSLREATPENQQRIVSSIPDIGEPLVSPLLAMLERGDTQSRQGAAFILGKIRTPTAVSALGRATQDEDWTVAWYAAQALAETGDEDCLGYLVDLVATARSSPGAAKLHEVAVRGIGTIGGDKARATLRQVLVSEYEPHEVRNAAAYYLGELQDREAIPLLIETMAKFYYLRPAATVALQKITGQTFGNRPDLWRNWYESAPQPPPLYKDLVPSTRAP